MWSSWSLYLRQEACGGSSGRQTEPEASFSRRRRLTRRRGMLLNAPRHHHRLVVRVVVTWVDAAGRAAAQAQVTTAFKTPSRLFAGKQLLSMSPMSSSPPPHRSSVRECSATATGWRSGPNKCSAVRRRRSGRLDPECRNHRRPYVESCTAGAVWEGTDMSVSERDVVSSFGLVAAERGDSSEQPRERLTVCWKQS